MTLAKAIRWTTICEAALFVVVAVSGVYVGFTYRPDGSRLVVFGENPELARSIRLAATARNVHLVAAALFVFGAVALALLFVYAQIERRGRADVLVAGLAIAFALLTLGATFTGYLLPWDQLALKSVTAVEDYRGMWTAAFDDNVRFVLIESREITQATLRNWLLVHVVAIPALLTATLALVLRRNRAH